MVLLQKLDGGNQNINELHETNFSLLINHSENNYIGLKPIPFMKELVMNLDCHRQYCLSNTHNSIEDNNKHKVMDNDFPNIKYDKRFFTRNIEEKIDVLHMILIKNQNIETVYISDSLQELITMNNYFRDNGFNKIFFYHTSSLFV